MLYSNLVRPDSRFNFSLKIHKTQTALHKTRQLPGRNILMHYIFQFLMPDRIQVVPGSRFTISLKIHKTQMPYSNQTRSGEKHIYALYFLVPNARQDPGRAGQHIHFQLKNSQGAKCLRETRQDSGRNIFMHYIFWFLMPDAILVRPGSIFTLA